MPKVLLAHAVNILWPRACATPTQRATVDESRWYLFPPPFAETEELDKVEDGRGQVQFLRQRRRKNRHLRAVGQIRRVAHLGHRGHRELGPQEKLVSVLRHAVVAENRQHRVLPVQLYHRPGHQDHGELWPRAVRMLFCTCVQIIS